VDDSLPLPQQDEKRADKDVSAPSWVAKMRVASLFPASTNTPGNDLPNSLLQIFRPQPGFFGYALQHATANLFTLMKGEDKIIVTLTL